MIISFDTFGAWATAVKEAKQEQEKNITITENGTGSVLPDSGKTLSKVDYTVDVHPKRRLNEEFTVNGEYNLTGEWKDGVVYVDVPQTVISKVDVAATGTRLAYSTFTTVPDIYDFSNCEDMRIMLGYCYNVTNAGLITATKATNIESICTKCTSLIEAIIPSTNLTIIDNAFRDCSALQVVVMNVDKVTRMDAAFAGCSKLTEIYGLNGDSFIPDSLIPDFDTSSCTSMTSLFDGCTSLVKLPRLNMSNMPNKNYNEYVLRNCTSLTTLPLEGLLNVDLDVHWSPLNEESIKSVLTAASKTTNTTAKTLTFKEGSTLKDTDGVWAALVADCTTKRWTINNLTITPAA